METKKSGQRIRRLDDAAIITVVDKNAQNSAGIR